MSGYILGIIGLGATGFIISMVFRVPFKISAKISAVLIVACLVIGIVMTLLTIGAFKLHSVSYRTHHTYGYTAQDDALPLPPKTTLGGRLSQTDASYFTKLTIDEIIDFYSQIADDRTFSRSDDDEKIDLLFTYRDSEVSVIIKLEEAEANKRIFYVYRN